MSEPIKTKQCGVCKQIKPLSEFYFPTHTNPHRSISSWCKPCSRAAYRRRKEANRTIHPYPADLPNEEWRPVIGLEDVYSVSNMGRMRREARAPGTHPGYLLKPRPDHEGYMKVNLKYQGRIIRKSVHVFVAAAFIGPCPEGQEVNHIDPDNANNRADNLEYTTHLENIRHSIRLGRYKHLGKAPQSVPARS